MGALIVGAAMLAIAAAVWTGTLESAQRAPLWRNAPLTVVPGFGVMLVAVGLKLIGVISSDHSLVLDVALLVLGAGGIVFIWDPPWWGPRWYREQRRR